MTILEVLKKARELISDPAHWTQGAFARTYGGLRVSSTCEQACCYCASGAIRRACSRASYPFLYFNLIDMATEALQAEVGEWVPEFNDSHTHAEVLGAFDRAISKLEGTSFNP